MGRLRVLSGGDVCRMRTVTVPVPLHPQLKRGTLTSIIRQPGLLRELYRSRTTNKRIVLLDGDELAQLMMDHGVGVTTIATYLVQKVDSDYFRSMP